MAHSRLCGHRTSSSFLVLSRASIAGPRSVCETGGRDEMSSGNCPSTVNAMMASLICLGSVIVAMARGRKLG